MTRKCCDTNIPKGVLVDRYTVQAHIHNKAVYFATEQNTEREVVLKRAHDFRINKTGLTPRQIGNIALRHESYLQSRLEHPNICPVEKIVEHREKFYLVLPNVGTKNLYHHVKYNNPPTEEKLMILEDIANALAHCHEKSIVHLDVKERNVIVKDKKGTLIDFGAARLWGSSHQIVDQILCYTPDSGAPEHARNKGSTFTPLSDTFSFSYMTFWALTGNAAYRTYTDPMYAIQQHHPLSLAQFNGLGDLVIQGLSIDPGKRPPINEIADALKEHTARLRRQHDESTAALSPSSYQQALQQKTETSQYTKASYAAGRQPQPAPLS